MTGQTDKRVMLHRALGATPPQKITQEAFEHDDSHLRRLVRLKLGERAKPEDLFEYTQDLRYTEVEGPLLAYLLPFCLEV